MTFNNPNTLFKKKKKLSNLDIVTNKNSKPGIHVTIFGSVHELDQ